MYAGVVWRAMDFAMISQHLPFLISQHLPFLTLRLRTAHTVCPPAYFRSAGSA
jgi:hypothetical protein